MIMKKPWDFRVIYRQRCHIFRYFNLDISRQTEDAACGKVELEKDFSRTIYKILCDLRTNIPIGSSMWIK